VKATPFGKNRSRSAAMQLPGADIDHSLTAKYNNRLCLGRPTEVDYVGERGGDYGRHAASDLFFGIDADFPRKL